MREHVTAKIIGVQDDIAHLEARLVAVPMVGSADWLELEDLIALQRARIPVLIELGDMTDDQLAVRALTRLADYATAPTFSVRVDLGAIAFTLGLPGLEELLMYLEAREAA